MFAITRFFGSLPTVSVTIAIISFFVAFAGIVVNASNQSSTSTSDDMFFPSIHSLSHWNDQQIKQHASEVCDELTTRDGTILAIGKTKRRFVIVTSTLYVFELNLEQLDPYRIPPYKILVTKDAIHMRHRWPTAYRKLAPIVGSILYAFTTGFSNTDTIYENVVFVFANPNATAEDKVCTAVLDIVQDGLDFGLCDNSLIEYRIGSINGRLHAGTPFQSNDTYCCIGTGLFMSLQNSEGEEQQQANSQFSCEAFTDCEIFFSFENLWSCFATPNRITHFFSYDSQSQYLIDSRKIVFPLRGDAQDNDTSEQPLLLSQFIACKVAPPFSFRLTKHNALIFVTIFAIIQVTLILACLYAFLRNRNSTMQQQQLPTKEQSGKKRRKLNKSSMLSSSPLSSMASVSPSPSASKLRRAKSLSKRNKTKASPSGQSVKSHSPISELSSSKISKANSKTKNKKGSPRSGAHNLSATSHSRNLRKSSINSKRSRVSSKNVSRKRPSLILPSNTNSSVSGRKTNFSRKSVSSKKKSFASNVSFEQTQGSRGFSTSSKAQQSTHQKSFPSAM